MKVLLIGINAKYIHSNPAVYSLKAYADKYYPHRPDGCVLGIAEYTINQTVQSILAELYRQQPQIAAFSCYIWNWTIIQALLSELPKVLPDTALWLGGPEVSYDAEDLLRTYPQLTGIMVGEGEETFLELLRYYWEHKTALSDIKGIVCKEGFTGERGLVDMNRLPFLYAPDADTATENVQYAVPAAFQNRILYYESQRGCPFQCSYCLSSIDKAVRIRDMGLVEEELQFFLDHRVRQVKFIDRTFNCSHAHAMAVWTYLLEHDNGVTNFHFEISADILREEEIELLSRFRPGLAQMEIGVQTVNPRTLEAIRRTMDIKRLESAVAAIRRGGNVHLHLDLIAGLPYEGYESFGKSFDWVYRLRPHQLQLGFLKVLKGSEMWERAQEYGIRYLEQPPYEVLCTDWLSYEEVLRLKGVEEMVELYYNSGQFVHTLNFLENAFPGPFAMYEALADFYRVEGHLAMSPARASRYQVLLDFAGRRDPRRREVYRELLTYDLYLRENAKSRPGFAPDISAWKEAARSFYREEEQRRRYLPDYEGFDSRQLGRMTHLEPFAYPVWDIDRMAAGYGAFRAGESMGHTFVLFDYRSRSPLNHEALARPIHGGLDSATGCCTDL